MDRQEPAALRWEPCERARRKPMNSDRGTLEGTLERVVFSNPENAWSVVKLSVPGDGGPVTAVGNLLGVRPGESLRLHGGWVDDPKFGRQFRVDSYLPIAPDTVAGIERYLGSGLIPGIGPKMAKRLVARFGMETLDVIERDPERLKKVRGIGKKRRQQIHEAWAAQREVKDLMIFLGSHGVATHHAAKIFKTYGGGAMAVVREDPYRLSADVYGIGFASADRIAAALGLPADSPQRARAGLLHMLSTAADQGHVYLPRERLLADAATLLEVDREPLAPALEALARNGEVTVAEPPAAVHGLEPRPRPLGDEVTEDNPAVYAKPLAVAEQGLAARLGALIADRTKLPAIDADKALAWFERKEGIRLAGQQREAIRRGLSSRVLVITGGPGTGKTTLVQGIVAILGAKKQRVLLAAPTGRAAKRLAEATGREAKTVHRLLEFNPRSRTFERGFERPLDADLVILDEASMLDTALAYHVSKAIPAGCRLVLVGDVDQLPSVGPGRVLADLIDSGAVDVVRLTEIFRQAAASLIVQNAHRVNKGEMPDLRSAHPEADFFFIDRRDPESVLDTLVHVVCDRIPEGFGIEPLDGIQVLTPMNRGPLGTENLNRVLRERLNPSGREVTRGARSFRVGDKVMQIRNNYELDVFNGDLGRVAAIDEDEKRVRLVFDGRTVHHEFAHLDELTLAYACSIHKSQGSEYPAVVVPIHTTHWVMLQRNLLYTALTRAQRLVVLIGELKALAVAVRNQKTTERFTLLAERLRAGAGGSARSS